MNKWISVDKRLPKFDGWVLVWHKEEHNFAYFDSDALSFRVYGYLRNGKQKPTHWMYLPKPPSTVPDRLKENDE